MARPDLRSALIVFIITLVVYGLSAWDRVLQPSPHFHFADLAQSFLKGRLDTDTPRTDPKRPPADAPRGFAEATKRHALNRDGGFLGWNDWASYRTLTLKNGEVIRGVFPWRDQKERQKEFRALDGTLYQIDCARDVKSGCWGNKPGEMHYFVSFPPMPAVLMLPLVKVFGYDTNDVLFTLFFAALNGALLYLLLDWLSRRGLSPRTRGENLWLTAMFLAGSVHFFSAIRGEVWFTALIVGVTFNLLAIFASLAGRMLLAGLCFGLAFATRTPLLFGAILPVLLELFPEGRLRRDGWGRAFGRLVLFGLPVAVIGGVLAWYNWTRFQSFGEFGHTYLQEGARPSIREHGLMSGWFLLPNFNAAFANAPVITFESWPWLRITKHGLGLAWTTPALFLIFGSRRPLESASGARRAAFWALVAATAAVAVPGLLYQNTGWEQFGYRFGLDWLPYLIVAFAVAGRPLTRPTLALILFGIVVNAIGAASFGRYAPMYF